MLATWVAQSSQVIVRASGISAMVAVLKRHATIAENPGFGSDGIFILSRGDCAEPSGKAGTRAAVGILGQHDGLAGRRGLAAASI